MTILMVTGMIMTTIMAMVTIMITGRASTRIIWKNYLGRRKMLPSRNPR